MATLDIASLSRTEGGAAPAPGVMTASLLTVLLVSTVVGGVTALALKGVLSPAISAVAAGLVGTVAAGLARNTLLVRVWEAAGVEDAGTPASIVFSAAVASLAGSLSAYELAGEIGRVWPGVLGMLAGLLSAALMGMLMLAHALALPAEKAR
jgi:hypothetical protein